MDDVDSEPQLSALEGLPLECWIAIALQSSDRYGLLTSVPLVSRRLRETLHDPWLRCSVLRAIHGGGAQSESVQNKQAEENARVSVVSTGRAFAVQFQTELEQRTDLSRWRQQQRILMCSAIERRSLRTVRQTLADGFDPEQPDARGVTPLFLSMKHDNPDALMAILGLEDTSNTQEETLIRLPAPAASCPSLDISTTTSGSNIIFGSGFNPALYGQNLLQIVHAGIDMPGCCPLLTGVLYHSVEAVRAMLRLLLSSRTVVAADGVSPPLSGQEYLNIALSSDYACMFAAEIQGPTFGCGTAMAWWHMHNPGFMQLVGKSSRLRKQGWGLLELELRRPDSDPTMLRLLASAHVATGATPAAGFETLATIVAIKNSLCQFRDSLGHHVAEIARLLAPVSEDAHPEEPPPNFSLNDRCSVLESSQRRRRARLVRLNRAICECETLLEAKEELRLRFHQSVGMVGVRSVQETSVLLSTWPGWDMGAQSVQDTGAPGAHERLHEAATELGHVLRDGSGELGVSASLLA
jgi:hypothetical protein